MVFTPSFALDRFRPSTRVGDHLLGRQEMTEQGQAPVAEPSIAPLLALVGATKRFGGATALDDVDFDLLPGEIHGLVG